MADRNLNNFKYKLAINNTTAKKFIVDSYRLVRKINAIMLNAAISLLALLTIAVALDVVMRYVFNSPLTGVKQFAEYSLVWLCFLSAGWVLIQRKHVAISYLEVSVFRKTKKRKKWFSIFIDFMCLLYTAPLLWLSAKSVSIEFVEKTVISGEAGGFPTFIAEFCIPLGFFCLTTILILRIAAFVLGIEERDSVLIDLDSTKTSNTFE